jgi:hypothetical protein
MAIMNGKYSHSDKGEEKTDGGIVCKQIWINAKLQIGKRGKKQRWLGEVHEGGKSLHWTVVPLKKKKGKWLL